MQLPLGPAQGLLVGQGAVFGKLPLQGGKLGPGGVQFLPGLGEAADFEGLDVAGKIAVISRGTINFSLKLYNAEQAGAAGVIIYNNEPGIIYLQMANEDGSLNDGISGNVPCVAVSQAVGEILAAAETKKLVISSEDGPAPSETAGQMSDFSSWGVTPSLELKPEVAPRDMLMTSTSSSRASSMAAIRSS